MSNPAGWSAPTGHHLEGYPYECIADWDPAQYQHAGSERINRGTQGKVVIVNAASGAAFVTMVLNDSIRAGGPFRSGWVPLSYIRISTVRKYGDLLFRGNVNPGPSLGQGTSESDGRYEIQWTKVFIPAWNMAIFRRPSLTVGRTTGSTYAQILILDEPVHLKTTPTAGSFELCLGNDFPFDKQVDIVFEVMENNQVHEYHWSALPTHGPYTCWDEARSFAIKLEWVGDDGVRRHKYLYSKSPLSARLHHQDAPPAIDTYAQAIAAVRYLKQQRFNPQTKLPFLYNYGVANVKVQTYDHMNQTMTFTDVFGNRDSTPSPLKRGYQEIRTELRGLGLNVGGAFGVTDHENSSPRFPPGACDSCHLLNTQSRRPSTDPGQYPYQEVAKLPNQQRECVRARNPHNQNGPDQCKSCVALGRICSWTKAIHWIPTDDPQIAALIPPTHSDTGMGAPMPDPGLTVLDTRDFT